MTQFPHAPALDDILICLRCGEALSAKEIKARTNRGINSSQREKLVEAGLIDAAKTGRSASYEYRITATGIAYVDGLGRASTTFEQPEANTAKLSDRERRVLFSLLSSEPSVSGSEIKRRTGVVVTPQIRERLAAMGLLTFEKGPRNTFVYELTEHGWRVASDELWMAAPITDDAPMRLLHDIASTWLPVLKAKGIELTDLYVGSPKVVAADIHPIWPGIETVGARVINAYPALALEVGGWVGLRRLREHLADIDRDELDRVLKSLFRDDRIKLISEVNQKTLTDEDRAAALHVVGDEKHLYLVG